ncbi:MAG: ABC transporter substrate-binding protein [Hungatella hathewayi]|nr:ABC transporter substrate-binding protein [Hungatella hathewayi]
MKKVRRAASMLLAMTMAFTLTACQSQPKSSETAPPDTKAEAASGTENTESTTAVPQPAASGDTIKIGVLATLTGYPLNGEHMRNGILLAIDEINANGGVLGRQLEADVQDCSNTTDIAINATNKLVSNHVAGIIGPHYSSLGLAVESIIKDAKVPMLVGGTSPKFVSDVDNDYLFRIRASDTLQAAAAAAYLVDGLKATKVAILYGSDDFGTGGMQVASGYFDSVGVSYCVQSFNNEDTDVTSQILKCINEGCDAALIWATEVAYPIVARQMFELGLTVPTITNPSLAVDSCLAQLDPEWVEGWYCVTDFLTNNPTDKVQDFIKRYTAVYGTDESVDLHCAAYYSATYALADAIERAGTTDGEALSKALLGTKDVEGIVGNLTSNEDGEMISEIILAQCRDLKIEYIDVIR